MKILKLKKKTQQNKKKDAIISEIDKYIYKKTNGTNYYHFTKLLKLNSSSLIHTDPELHKQI